MESRRHKLIAAAIVVAAAAVFNYLFVWAEYGLRFDAGPNGLCLDTSKYVQILRYVQSFNVANRPPTPEQLVDWQMPLSTRLMLFAETHHLFPQAWIAGYLYTQEGSESRLCFLVGQFYNGGKWYFFPLAALIKSPLATIIAVIVSGWIGLRLLRRGFFKQSGRRWAALSLSIPPAIYALTAMTANVNIGLRHFFPVYPFIFLGAGLAFAWIWSMGKPGKVFAVSLALGLAVETASAYPNYIDFFGIGCGGSSAGYSLLSDSNLDWGQDLPLLAQWQQAHPGVPLYLDYFGRCDPAVYGIRYVNLENGYEFGPPPQEPDRPGVAAVSATNLHLLNAYDRPPHWLDLIKGHKPMTILGGTIYLFDVNPKVAR